MSQELNFILRKLAAELKTDELSIPSMPELVNELSSQIGNANLSVKDLASIICTDTGITSQIIRTAQTLRYSNPGTTVTSIPNAISRIGVTSSVNLALALALEQNFNFKIPFIHKICQQVIKRSNRIAFYAMMACTIKYSHLSNVIFDYVILASTLLNLGYLPFLYELEAYISNKDPKTQLTLTEQQLSSKFEEIQYPLAIAILRHWKFDSSFEVAVKLEEDRSFEFYVNSLSYANSYIKTCLQESFTVHTPNTLAEIIGHQFTDDELIHMKDWLEKQGII